MPNALHLPPPSTFPLLPPPPSGVLLQRDIAVGGGSGRLYGGRESGGELGKRNFEQEFAKDAGEDKEEKERAGE